MNEWAFEMYDWNEDGMLDILDLSYFKKEVPERSPLHAEIAQLTTEYIDAKVFRRTAQGIGPVAFSVMLARDSVLGLVVGSVECRSSGISCLGKMVKSMCIRRKRCMGIG